MNEYFKTQIYTLLSATLLLLATFTPVAEAQDSTAGWHTLTPAAGEPIHRHENAYVRVDDKFYLIGGRGIRPVQIYDPATNTWTTGAPPPLSMHHFQAVAFKGKVYVIGAFTGQYPDEEPIPNVYIYNPKNDTWTKGAKIPADRRRGAAGAVAYNGKIYLIGGIRNGHIDGHVRWLDSFAPATDSWKKLPNAPHYRDHFQAAVIDGKLYAVGGRRTSKATGQLFELTVPEVDVYDFSANRWTTLPPSSNIPTERAGSTTVSVGNKLIVLGGESGSQKQAHAEVELFNPATGQWRSLPDMNQGRHGTQAIVYQNKIYIVAGSKIRGADEINSQEVLKLPQSVIDS